MPLRAKPESCQTTRRQRSSLLTVGSFGLHQRTPILEQSSKLHNLKEFSEHMMAKPTKRLLPSFSFFCCYEIRNIGKLASFLPLVLEIRTWKLETERRGEGSQRRQSAGLRHFATRLFNGSVWPLQLCSTRWRNMGACEWGYGLLRERLRSECWSGTWRGSQAREQ